MTLVEIDYLSGGQVARLTLNDPANLNAMSEDMAAEFAKSVGKIRDSANLRAVILTGAGKAFSAGGSLSMLEAKTKRTAEENRLAMLKFYDSFLCLRSVAAPFIAAINGSAIGAGLCVACACDIRVASEDAKLGFTFTKLGLHPGMGASFFVPRALGYAAASELLLTARVIGAEEALRYGLVSRTFKKEELLSGAEQIAAEIAACGPEASRQLLETLRSDNCSNLQSALEREALCQSVNYASCEFAEGLKAVQQKRSPKFS